MPPLSDLPVIVTYDWVPDFPRGLVRDIRPRWAFEEAGLAYRVETVPFQPKTEAHLAMQPFGQVPILHLDGRTIFETGAILHAIGLKTPALMPADRAGEVLQWLFAALNSVEMMTQPWIFMKAAEAAPQIFGAPPAPEVVERAAGRMNARLDAMERVLSGRDWLAGGFTVADIAMVEVLRPAARRDALQPYPALQSYLARATARPAFQKAHADQMAHWQAADAARTLSDPGKGHAHDR
jgi:glutathione S-transferase